MLVNNKSGKSHRREQPLSAPHTVEGFARHGVAEVRRNAQMAPPVAILDPRRDKLDRKLPRMSGEAREVSRLREALQIAPGREDHRQLARSEEHTSELQSLMRISYAVFCLQKKNKSTPN